MTYPGNSSLSEDIQERIQSTYRQTLELASQGNRQEASLGCDFILRLDPEFTPAHKLLERLEDGDGPVPVDDLRPGASGFAAAEPEPVAEAAEEGATGLSKNELADELRSLLDQGEHEEVVLLAEAERQRVMADPELQEIARTAQNRQEADPYIQSFLGKAREALRHDELEQARRYLDNARELDPEHPAIRDFSAVLRARGGDAPGAGPEATEGDAMPDLELDSLDLGEEPPQEPADSLAGGFSLDDTSGGSETDARIRELLAEGQAAFDRGEHQEAIDAWSRIFLIDIDHREAARRIEKARSLKDERERQVEETFHDAVSKLEAGRTREAKALFQKVLELQPSHLAAREYLQEIEEGRAPAAGAPAAQEASADAFATPGTDDGEPLSHEILVPPDPGEPSAPAQAPAPVQAAATSSSSSLPSRTFLLVGGLVLVVVVAAAWFFFQRRDSLFPNANEEPAVQAGATVDPIERATRLHDAGRTDQALARLRQIPQEAEQYDDAQALISQWQAEAASPGEAATTGAEAGLAAGGQDTGTSRRDQLMAQAEGFLQSGENLRAMEALDLAASISPLENEETRLRRQAEEALEPLASEISLVRGGDWEFALRDLWTLHEAEPQNRDVTRLLTTAYYNLGVRDLQRGDAEGAAESFEEALGFARDDPELQRHLRFARAYERSQKDLLYEIYARKLSFRAP